VKKYISMTVWLLLLSVSGYARQSYSAPAAGSLPQYDLSIRIWPDAHRLEVAGSIRLPATNSARDSIELSLSELMTDFRVEVIGPASAAGSAITEKVTVRPYSRPGWGTATWRVHFAHPITGGTPLLLRFTYSGGGAQTSFIFSLESEVCFGAGIGTAWYPEIEDGEVQSDGRLRGLKGTGSLKFFVPPGYILYSQGKSLSKPEEIARGNFRFGIDKPVFFAFAAGRYTVQHEHGRIPTALYLLKARGNARSYLTGSEKVLDALVHEFGPYPHPEFAILEVPTEQADRAGFSGASIEGFMLSNTDFLDRNFNTAFFGHEISHQWWGNLIRSKTVQGRWMMSEGMAQFGSLRAVEILEGAVAAERYRRTGYPDYISDQDALGYFTLIAKGTDHRLSDLPQDGDLSRVLSDSKGFIVWDMLSREVGRRQFSHTLQSFLRAHANQRVEWNELLRVIEKAAGRNLRWFYEQWFERTGAPDFQFSWKQEGRRLRVVITQTSPYYQATLEIEIKNKEGRRLIRKVRLRKARASFSFPINFPVESVELDPHYFVLRWTPKYRAVANAARSF
jgi:Peptidase family M1 domain